MAYVFTERGLTSAEYEIIKIDAPIIRGIVATSTMKNANSNWITRMALLHKALYGGPLPQLTGHGAHILQMFKRILAKIDAYETNYLKDAKKKETETHTDIKDRKPTRTVTERPDSPVSYSERVRTKR